jgi:hypothetical protein
VSYQASCPILLEDVQINFAATLFESVALQNVSSEPIDEITVGILAGTSEVGVPRPLVAEQTLSTRIAPGERRRVALHLGAGDVGPLNAARQDFLMTLGVVQVRSRGTSLWVSSVTTGGDFIAARWPSPTESHHWCMDERRRLYSPGAVLFDGTRTARVCRPDGTWAPR